jgi:hypothetical protein
MGDGPRQRVIVGGLVRRAVLGVGRLDLGRHGCLVLAVAGEVGQRTVPQDAAGCGNVVPLIERFGLLVADPLVNPANCIYADAPCSFAG